MKPVFLTLLLSLFASVEASSQIDPGFSWVRPHPTGELLYDVENLGPGIFVAVSTNGFLHRTTDAGVTWSFIGTELDGSLWAIDTKSGLTVATGKGGRAYRSRDAGVSWTIDRIPDLGQTLSDVAVLNDMTVVAVSSNLSQTGVIVRSTDGGASWTIYDPDLLVAFRSVDFVDEMHGWATGTYGILLKTSDGGISWARDTTAMLYGTALNTVRFRDTLRGVVAGEFGKVFVTHDGGKNWNAYPQRSNAIFQDGAWLDDTTVVLTGEYLQLRSTDAGESWEDMRFGWRFLGMGFGIDRTEGMVVGIGGDMFHTSDGGVRWTSPYRSGGGERIMHMTAYGDSTLICVGGRGSVLTSHDAGYSWERSTARTDDDFNTLTRVAYPSEGNLVAIATEGYIVHSNSGGKEWGKALGKTPRYLQDLSFGDEVTGWAVGNRLLVKTTDGGKNWNVDSTSVPKLLWGVHAVSKDLVYVTGHGGILFVSRDGGERWIEIETPYTVRFSMVTANESGEITMGWQGGLVYSSDGGETWSDHRAPEGSDIRGFSFLTPQYGWCGQDTGPLLITTDAGATWTSREHGVRQSSFGQSMMKVVHAMERGRGYVAGDAGYVLEYRDPEVSGVDDEWPLPPRDSMRQGSLDLVIDGGVLQVRGSANTVEEVMIFDVLGRVVARSLISASGGIVEIEVAVLPAGVYYVQNSSGAVGVFVRR